ncbi:MAG: Dyp-type peroxidase [Nitrososphaeraceae archaeon]
MNNRLQEGIYFDVGTKPGKFFGLLFLRANHKFNSRRIGTDLAKIWEMYKNLRNGRVRDLGKHRVPAGDLKLALGFGLRCFELDKIKLPSPVEFIEYGSFHSPAADEPILTGSGLKYGKDISHLKEAEDFVIQATADTQLAVYRTVIETWKFIQDELLDEEFNEPSITLVNFYSGFQREDYRSWLDFHDGISNMKSGNERLSAITIQNISQEEYGWAKNGTYMAFLRIVIDLTVWRNLTRPQQEIIVGRDKLTGCPIKEIDENGNPVILEGCPAPGTVDITQKENAKFCEISMFLEKRLRQSHVARVRHSGNDFSEDSDSLRIFRQGYEFLESISTPPYFRTGLNFVSFQNNPKRLHNILVGRAWLGRTNFGGDPDNPIGKENDLITVHSAGFYYVPPFIEDEPFPGSRILM